MASTCSLLSFDPPDMSSLTVVLPPDVVSTQFPLRSTGRLSTIRPSTVVVGRLLQGMICIRISGDYDYIYDTLERTHQHKANTKLLVDVSEGTREAISYLLEAVEQYPTEIALLPFQETCFSWCIATSLSSLLFHLKPLLSLLHPPLSPLPSSCPSSIFGPPLSPLCPGVGSTQCGSPDSVVSIPSSSPRTPPFLPAGSRLWEEFGTDGGPARIVGDVRPLQLLGQRSERKQEEDEEVTLAGLGTFLKGCHQLKDEFCVIETTIPIQLARFLIGMRGSQVKRIQMMTGATVNLSRSLDPSPSPNSRKLQITGSLQSVYAALALSQSLLVNRTPPSTIAPPLHLGAKEEEELAERGQFGTQQEGDRKKTEEPRQQNEKGKTEKWWRREPKFCERDQIADKVQRAFAGLEAVNYMAGMARNYQ
eukprot:GHVS01000464.1.p1 GENE.GHVS01000464.1~~GHVS01000464.1.p1  ORF type:complete len:474 (+),score=75.15 GHVS01000464.1:162-1424(+)